MALPSQFDYEKYTNMAFHRRGALINEIIMLERLIDDYISYNFCGADWEKKVELMELIICTNRIIFENKVQILKCLLERHHPEILEKYPRLIKDITDTIIPQRNNFAHFWLVTTQEMTHWVKEKKTVLVKFKNKTEYIEYNDADFSALMILVGDCIKVFMDFQKKYDASTNNQND